jgi:adenine-specific DNA-methyltransferase
MQNNTSPDTNGLKAILKHNETAQPNDALLNTLKTAIPQFFDKDGNFKTDKFEDELKKNNIAEARDGYKLGFVGKDYARLQVGLKSETMIVPDKRHNDQPENANSGNVFITGDNIDALRHLVNAYENQIKLIYIDPPYNTGKEREFVYSDKFEFTDEKLKSILSYTDDEIVRLKSIQGKSSHSAWLTFMYPRLKIAQKLLKNDGVIFVSIDDNEQANLKLIMDDVFGESNFLGDIIWNSTKSVTNTALISVSHTYNLVYFKNINYFIENRYEFRLPEDGEGFENPDNDPRGDWKADPFQVGGWRPNQQYTIINPNTGISYKPNPDCSWKNDYEKFQELLKDNRIIFGKTNESGPQRKRFIWEAQERGKVAKTLWDDIETTTNGTQLIKNIFKDVVVFKNPKPVELLKRILQITTSNCLTTNNSPLILDFFAGSATTAHAVMQLNSEDDGNRKFIIVQLNEETNPDLEARKAGYNTIDEIARDRIRIAGEKILSDYEREHGKQTNGWDKDIGFKHYRLVTPDVKTLEKIIEFNPEETNLIADDMIKPFEYKKTETGGLDTILTTWLIDDGYRFDTPVEEITFGNYKAHYVREEMMLYLINMGWDTKALKEMLNQIGTNKLLVNTIVVYPYSFEFEAMREIKTNIKTSLDKLPNLIERY